MRRVREKQKTAKEHGSDFDARVLMVLVTDVKMLADVVGRVSVVVATLATKHGVSMPPIAG